MGIEEGRLLLDTCGHYSRPDIFRLSVNIEPQENTPFHSGGPSEETDRSCRNLTAAVFVTAKETEIFPILKSNAAIGKNGASYLLPTNQLIRPWGEQLQIPGRPVDLAFDSRKHLLAILNTRSILIVDGTTGVEQAVVKLGNTSYTGLAFRPGDREIWASETTRNGPDQIAVVELSATGKPMATVQIDLPGHPVPSGIAFSADGNLAYVAFSRNNTVAVIDAATRRLLREVPAGMVPFDVLVAPRTGAVYVSNRAGRRPTATDSVAPSSGSMVVTDPTTGSTTTGTISILDPKTFATQELAVGLAPSNLAISPDGQTLAVANGHSDSVSLIDTATRKRTDVAIQTWPGKGLGSQPIALVFAPDGKRLYVACGGNNAVAILTRSGKQWKVSGAVPTGWFPSALEIDGEGALRVLNIKGTGNTANKIGSFSSLQFAGTLTPLSTLTPKVALDEMNPPLKALTGRKLWAARQSMSMNWTEPDDVPQETLNTILWWDSKGYDTPYPVLTHSSRR